MVLESNIHSTEMGPNLNRLVDEERWGNSGREKRKMREAVTILQKSSSREHSWSTARNHCCANTDVKRRTTGRGHMVPGPVAEFECHTDRANASLSHYDGASNGPWYI